MTTENSTSAQSTAIVKYQPYEEEDAAAEAEKWEESPFGDFFEFKEGTSKIRILPALPGKGYGPKKTSPFLVTWSHYVESGDFKWNFVCPRMEAKKRCPSCEKADQLRKSGNPADFDRAKAYLPRRRSMVNVIDRAHPEKGPQHCRIGKTIHEALATLRKEEGDFTHPEKGYDILVTRKGTKRDDTEYLVRPDRTDSPLGDMVWIEQQHDLSRFGVVMLADDIVEYVRSRGKSSGGAAAGGGRQQRRDAPPPQKDADFTAEEEEAARTASGTVEGDVVDGEVNNSSAPL